jgi:hypothetical protein
VIPTGRRRRFPGATDAAFVALFRRFYPGLDLSPYMGRPGQFVPWRPIRPAAEFTRLSRQAGPRRLDVRHERAVRIAMHDATVTVHTDAGHHRAARVWVAAGALHTPVLLATSWGPDLRRERLADHVLCYLGQVRGHEPPRVSHSREGIVLQGWADGDALGLYTLRPAVFGFRVLDYGFEQRAVFGMPTGRILQKLARRLSPGLLAEAVYNRFGVLARAAVHSVYAQTHVADAYQLGSGAQPLQTCHATVRRATDRMRAAQPFAGLQASRRPDLALPGIHLHDSLDGEALARHGIDVPGSPVQVVDASALSDVGPEHHSFEMLVAAHERARLSGV